VWNGVDSRGVWELNDDLALFAVVARGLDIDLDHTYNEMF
jgi:hypothetical protein